jgi:hypothetical protein
VRVVGTAEGFSQRSAASWGMRSTRRSARSSAAAEPAAPEPPTVDLNQLKRMLELLVKVAAGQHGVSTVDKDIEAEPAN